MLENRTYLDKHGLEQYAELSTQKYKNMFAPIEAASAAPVFTDDSDTDNWQTGVIYVYTGETTSELTKMHMYVVAASGSTEEVILDGSTLNWEQGSISASGGDTTSSVYIRTSNTTDKEYISVPSNSQISILYTSDITTYNGKNLQSYVYEYDSNKNAIDIDSSQSDIQCREHILADGVPQASITLDSSCAYIRFNLGSSQLSNMPTSQGSSFEAKLTIVRSAQVEDLGAYGGVTIDNTLSISNQAADAKVVGDRLAEEQDLIMFLTEHTEINGASIDWVNSKSIDTLGNIASSPYSSISEFIDASKLRDIKYTGPEQISINNVLYTPYVFICQCTSNDNHSGDRVDVVSDKEFKQYIYSNAGGQSGIYTNLDLSDECKYIVVLFGFRSSSHPSGATQYPDTSLFNALVSIKSSSRSTPAYVQSSNAQSVVNNYQKLLNLFYTTLDDTSIPQINTETIPGNTEFSATHPDGTSNMGVIYSSVKHSMGYVGNCISLYTYLSALAHPRSYIYTDDMSSAQQMPNNYGVEYTESNGKTYYGTVCSASAAYAFNIPIWSTWYWDKLPGMEKLPDDEQDATYLQAGDTLCVPSVSGVSGHVVLVYEVNRDSEGNITDIGTYEASGRAMLRQHRTIQQMNEDYSNFANYKIYRYRYLDLVTYESSPYVAVGNDTVLPGCDFDSLKDLKLVPKKGDRCNYLSSENIVLDYYSENPLTDSINIYKDYSNTPTNYSLAEISTGVYGVNIIAGTLIAGSYKATIKHQDESETDACYWIVVDVSSDAKQVSDSREDGVIVGYNHSNNAVPMYVYWESETSSNTYNAAVVYTDFIQGSPIVPPGFSVRIPQGSVTIHNGVSDVTYSNYVITKLPFKDDYSSASTSPSTVYPYYRFRVAFKTEYGVVFSTISSNYATYPSYTNN